MECPRVNNNNLNSHALCGSLPLYIDIWNLKFAKERKKKITIQDTTMSNCVLILIHSLLVPFGNTDVNQLISERYNSKHQ